MDTPLYLITGFLESGKTTFIKRLLKDDSFSMDERTVLIMCEDGMEEYEEDELKDTNTILVSVSEKSEFTDNFLKEIDKKYKPERVIMEYNNVWTMLSLFNHELPENWGLAQLISLVDSTTFDNYLNNMRNLMMDPIKEADVVVFNRAEALSNKSTYRKMVRAVNPSCKIYFETSDGNIDDGVTDEDLPYDMSADIIKINDEDFGTFYLDALEHPERYDGRTLRLKGMAFELKNLDKNVYAFGRYAMTCCADDVGAVGYSVFTDERHPAKEQWIELTVRASVGFSPVHRRDNLIFKQLKFKQAAAPKDELVTFN